jgi:hypothetical protein
MLTNPRLESLQCHETFTNNLFVAIKKIEGEIRESNYAARDFTRSEGIKYE